MPDVIHELYQHQVYPPMSHPLSDPAVSAVAARVGGLEVPHPRRARILEIGCCSGHNLIPLAMRWPESEFVGIDLAERSIDEARAHAEAAGLRNVCFQAADLLDFEPEGGPFDFIIAHGFFSWVPDRVKAGLLKFCRRHLSPAGIATISFNLESGWKPRLPVIAKVRAIQQARGGDEISALEILKSFTERGDPERGIIDDMLAKGSAILAFDDFGPVNDPWPLDRFAQAAAHAGLRWLGESDPGENIPSSLGDDVLQELKTRARSPLEFQLAVDEAAGRTFRSGVLCRDDAPVAERMSLEMIFDFSVGLGKEAEDREAAEIHGTLRSLAPVCVPLSRLVTLLPDRDAKWLVRKVFEGITRGAIRPRIEPLEYESEPTGFPKLDAFRLSCARGGWPLVDAWHKPCAFPSPHYQVLAAMDGSRSRTELAAFSKTCCPELAFEPWLRHLAWRGMFC
ncbi:MAG: class I SAM-dependent methyltransferase [Verrucomicrobiota bacterium]